MTSIAKTIKDQTDSIFRRRQTSPGSSIAVRGGTTEPGTGPGTAPVIVEPNNDLASHKTSADHDGRYYTEAEVDGKLNFLTLSDTPDTYVGQGGKVVAVKADVSGLEFVAAPAAANGVPAGGTTNQLAAKNSNTDYDLKWMDAPEAANGIPAGGTANQILAKIDSTNYNAQWIDAPSGGGAIIESRIGNLLPVVPSSGLTEKEAAWQRVVCLNDCSVTKVIFFIYAVIGNVRLKVAEVNSLTGNATIVDTIYTGSYAAPSSPPCVHVIESLAIELTKDKIYAFILESEIGTTLQMDASNDRAVLGQGSLLPASTNIGGYTTRGSTTLTAYKSSIIPIIIGYE